MCGAATIHKECPGHCEVVEYGIGILRNKDAAAQRCSGGLDLQPFRPDLVVGVDTPTSQVSGAVVDRGIRDAQRASVFNGTTGTGRRAVVKRDTVHLDLATIEDASTSKVSGTVLKDDVVHDHVRTLCKDSTALVIAVTIDKCDISYCDVACVGWHCDARLIPLSMNRSIAQDLPRCQTHSHT